MGVTDEDMAYLPGFLAGCERSGIPTQVLQPDEALRLEPLLNPALKVAVRVPDATMDAMRMPLRFFATAKANGADLLSWVDVIDLELAAGVVSGARVRDLVTGRETRIGADLVVNATGPWSEQVARMAGLDVPIRPSPGVMLAVQRAARMVINRLHSSGDGDIVVPNALSVIGLARGWSRIPTSRRRRRPRPTHDRRGVGARASGA